MVYREFGRKTLDPRSPRGAPRCSSGRSLKGGGVIIAALLAGCAAPGAWTKAGADDAAVTQATRDCRAVAAAAVGPEIGINQDILATRGTDWQRAQIGRTEQRTMQEHTRDRAAAIVDSCMRAKGFAPGP